VVIGTLAVSASATASAIDDFIFIGFAPFETFAALSPAHAKASYIPYYSLVLARNLELKLTFSMAGLFAS
jgi:hypothetical protein